MGKILILYDSATNNTAKMAKFVAEGVDSTPKMQIRVRHIDQAKASDISWCDGIAVGTPTNMGLLSWKMKRFWDVEMDDLWGKVDGKIGCAFSSSGGWGGGAEIACMSILTVLMNFGFLVFGVTDYVAQQTTLHYGAVIAGEPREKKHADACRKLGQKLAYWVACYVDKRKNLLNNHKNPEAR
jgi:NAD(P)H dehydrogenase (quinone)